MKNQIHYIILSLLLFPVISIAHQWDSQEEQLILRALLNECESNQIRLAKKITWHENIKKAIEILMKDGGVPEPKLSTSEMDRLLGLVCWFDNNTVFEMTAIDLVIDGGKLTTISNETLRQKITAWNHLIAETAKAVNQDYDVFFNVWMPFLRDNAYLAQISSAIKETPNGDPTFGTPPPMSLSPVDHRHLLIDRGFANVLLQCLWVRHDILYQYNKAGAPLNELVELLRQEIK